MHTRSLAGLKTAVLRYDALSGGIPLVRYSKNVFTAEYAESAENTIFVVLGDLCGE
jgi:hypothetical protein